MHKIERFGKFAYWLLLIAMAMTLGAVSARAQSISVPNSSFDFPPADFADPAMDAWQKAPQPVWYTDPTGFFPWQALMGQFLNTPAGDTNHIDNADGNHLAYLFALPEIAISQDFNTVSDINGAHQMNARFEAGKSYSLTVGVLGGGGGMSNGATFRISMYYRDLAGNKVTVAATTITNTPAVFPTNTHLVDFQARLPFVKAMDAWAGKHIGVELAATAGFDMMAGYWDVDNVRLAASTVPNHSFELPKTDFADPGMDSWQKAAAPIWYSDPTGFFPWQALMGEFANTPYGSSNHIDNVDGEQAAFLFALPDVAIFQDYNSIGGTNSSPTHDFNAKFEVGKSYSLTVGVLGGGGGMSNGATFEISMYYRDASSNIVTVAAKTITNTPTLFPTNTHLLDFQATTPTVKSGDAWAGKNIGIRLAATAGFDMMSGYWDVDNVRLVESVLPNPSFELPATDFADPALASWQKSAQPFWYSDPSGFFPWQALMGQFVNTPRGSSNYIDNIDGRQGSYLFALPGVAVFQDYTTIAGTNATPSYDFNAKFEPGKSYSLTVGVLGGSGGMSNGATFQISMYYRDAASNMVTVAATTITNSPGLFPTNTHLIDFSVRVPTVKTGDAWAGKNIGVQLAATAGFDMMAGYWDVDNVRLQEVRDPFLDGFAMVGGQFGFNLQSSPGQYEILSSTNIGLPSTNWTSLGAITNVSGTFPFSDTNTISAQRFYQARPTP